MTSALDLVHVTKVYNDAVAVRELDANGIVPATLTVRQPSLDDVFLSLTGRHVDPEPNQNSKVLSKVGAP